MHRKACTYTAKHRNEPFLPSQSSIPPKFIVIKTKHNSQDQLNLGKKNEGILCKIRHSTQTCAGRTYPYLHHSLVPGACLDHEGMGDMSRIVNRKPNSQNQVDHSNRVYCQAPEVPEGIHQYWGMVNMERRSRSKMGRYVYRIKVINSSLFTVLCYP